MLRIYFMDYITIKLQLNLRNVPFTIISACRIAIFLDNENGKYLKFKHLQKDVKQIKIYEL